MLARLMHLTWVCCHYWKRVWRHTCKNWASSPIGVVNYENVYLVDWANMLKKHCSVSEQQCNILLFSTYHLITEVFWRFAECKRKTKQLFYTCCLLSERIIWQNLHFHLLLVSQIKTKRKNMTLFYWCFVHNTVIASEDFITLFWSQSSPKVEF